MASDQGALEREPPQEAPRGGRVRLDREWLGYIQRHPLGRHPLGRHPLGQRHGLGRRHGLGHNARPASVPEGPEGFAEGVEAFNAGRFFAAHEHWETVWRGSRYPVSLFYLALTKLATGFAHAQRGNPAGARGGAGGGPTGGRRGARRSAR